MIVTIKSELSGTHIVNVAGVKHIRWKSGPTHITDIIIEYMDTTIISIAAYGTECEQLLQTLSRDIRQEVQSLDNRRSYLSACLNKES